MDYTSAAQYFWRLQDEATFLCLSRSHTLNCFWHVGDGRNGESAYGAKGVHEMHLGPWTGSSLQIMA